jgi:RecB family exonuclease
MDRVTKQDVARKTREGRRPNWLKTGEVLAGLKKRYTADINGVQLTGQIDDAARDIRGYTVIDYKTTGKTYDTATAQRLYGLQLTAYGYLLEQAGYWPVHTALLVFYEPDYSDDTTVVFATKPMSVTLDMPGLITLVHTASETASLRTPPTGRCTWCKYVEAAKAYR